MNQTGFDYAQEEIRKALVQEYMRKNPGVREQDVVVACKNGELVFTQISEVLADVELRKQSGQILMQANRMFSELAVHHDERWRECIQSSQHCMQITDCLHSSSFGYFSDIEHLRYQNAIKRLEGICATQTVQLHEVTKNLACLKTQDGISPSPQTRSAVIDYLILVIDQLKTLYSVFQQEIKLGGMFLKRAEIYFSIHSDDTFGQAASFSLLETLNELNSIKKNQEKVPLDINDAYQLNERVLIETKNALVKAVEEMKSILEKRRKRIQEVWTSVSSLEETVDDIEEFNSPNDEIGNSNKKQKSSKDEPEFDEGSSPRQMTRFNHSIKQSCHKF